MSRINLFFSFKWQGLFIVVTIFITLPIICFGHSLLSFHLVAALYQTISVNFSLSFAATAVLAVLGGAVFQRAGL